MLSRASSAGQDQQRHDDRRGNRDSKNDGKRDGSDAVIHQLRRTSNSAVRACGIGHA
jgi:hypothetical protein